MPYCSQCQLVHGEEHRFCQRCGQLLKGAPVAAARPCARCGELTYPGQKFCTDCGLPLRMAAVKREQEESAEVRPPLFYPRNAEPRSRRRQRRPRLAVTLVGLVVIGLVGLYAWRQLFPRVPVLSVPTVSAPQDDLRREVERLAEKIRAAHLNKDINKWLSAYDAAYPHLGSLENQILELWKNYDIKEVSYRIGNVQRLSDRQASAEIIWNIQVFDQRTHDYTLVRQGYKIILDKGAGGWKIMDSKEEGGGVS
jgi:ribosomal protein L37E